MSKKVLIGKEAVDKIVSGVNLLANAVKVTMGAGGKYVLIEDTNGMIPSLTKDGATVADSISSDDYFEELGVKMVREATNRSLMEVQDGTTTATVLCQALVNYGLDYPDAPKAYYEDLPKVIKALDLFSERPTQKQIKQVARLAANGDDEVGKVVAKAYKEVGKNGYVKVETTALDKTTLQVDKGYTVDTGLASPFFVTDQDTMECRLDESLVLVLKDKVNSLEDLYIYIKYSLEKELPLVVFSSDIEQNVLQQILVGNAKNSFKVVWLRLPDNIEKQLELSKDIAKMVGADVTSVISKRGDITKLGKATSVTVRNGSTSITSDEDVTEHVKTLVEKLPQTELDAFLKRRIQNLTSNLVTIKVGGLTDLDLRERRDRVDDAVGAVKSSFVKGILPGSGNVLAYLANTMDLDERFKLALKEPLKNILDNAGLPESSVEYDKGYDVSNGEYLDSLVDGGIIDSTHSVKSALEAAVSVACSILNTRCLITR